jgi:hypothetical protein
MLFAKMKMNVVMELVFPLGNVTREQADQQLEKPGAKEEITKAMIEALTEQAEDGVTINLADVTVEIAEI